LSHLGVPLLNPTQPKAALEAGREWADMAKSPLDYVRGVQESDRTALNTKEYKFFSYFQRIRDRLDRAWVPILKAKLVSFYKKGRHLASDKDHTTQLLVVLNKKGEVVRVQILGESGTNDLDEAAIKAFNQAGPFPNPPQGIINPIGEVEIPWEFVLRT